MIQKLIALNYKQLTRYKMIEKILNKNNVAYKIIDEEGNTTIVQP